MDYVLSITDNLFFDYLYAKALPLSSDAFTQAANATIEVAARLTTTNDPVSEYFGWKPSKYTVLSQLERDDWKRQAFSLFLITW